MQDASTMETIDLGAFVRPLVKRWWLLAMCAMLAGLAGAAYSLRQPALYRSSTTIMVGAALFNPNPSSNELSLEYQLAKAYADMADRTTIQEATLASLGLEKLPEYSARVVPNTQLIELEVIDKSPEQAQTVANELASQLIAATPGNQHDQNRQEFVEVQIAQLETGIIETNKEIERIEQELTQMFSARQIADAKAQISALESKLSTMQANYAAMLSNSHRGATNTISVLEPANLPKDRANDDLLLNVAASVLLGFSLAAVSAYALEFLDDTLRNEEDTSRHLNLPALGSIPRVTGQGTNGRGLLIINDRHTPQTDAYAALRLNIHAVALPDTPPKRLLVTSTLAGEGKSTVAANLSIELTRTGRRVVLVDADLYKPVQHRYFDLDNRGGITTYLLDADVRLEDLLQRTDIPGLTVLTSGPLVPNPSPLLSRERMQDLLNRLAETADVVVMDTPPLTATSASSILAKYADGVALVVWAGRTRRSLVQRTVRSLRQIHVPLLGVILYGTPLKQHMYRYSHAYQPNMDEPRKGKQRSEPARTRPGFAGNPAAAQPADGNLMDYKLISK